MPENVEEDVGGKVTEFRYNFNRDGILYSAAVPRYAFKFASISEYSIASIRDRYLWFSRPAEFNDIFELPIKVRQDYSVPELRSYLCANIAHHWPKLDLRMPDGSNLEAMVDTLLTDRPGFVDDLFRKLQLIRREIVRICCMSMRYDDPLMWAHYAASFTGICLVFDFPLLIDAGPWFALPVMYVDSIPTFDPVTTSLRFHAAANSYESIADNLEYDQAQFGIKLKAWAHEEELRLCTLSPEPKQHYPEEALLGVLVGPRANADAEQSVIEAAKHSKTRCIIERLKADDQKSVLEVSGLKNSSFELNIAGFRNLAKEMRHKDTRTSDA
jgi:hypothetical protein